MLSTFYNNNIQCSVAKVRPVTPSGMGDALGPATDARANVTLNYWFCRLCVHESLHTTNLQFNSRSHGYHHYWTDWTGFALRLISLAAIKPLVSRNAAMLSVVGRSTCIIYLQKYVPRRSIYYQMAVGQIFAYC